MQQRHSRHRLIATLTGAIIFTIGGGLWATYGAYSLHEIGKPILALVLILIVLCLCAAIFYVRSHVIKLPNEELSPEQQQAESRTGKMYGIINAVQGVAIFLAVQVCNNLHQKEFLPVAITVIVGLHFFALIPVMKIQHFWLLGIFMCALAIVTVSFVPMYMGTVRTPDAPFLWGAILGLGNAALLWMSTGYRLLTVRQTLQAS